MASPSPNSSYPTPSKTKPKLLQTSPQNSRTSLLHPRVSKLVLNSTENTALKFHHFGLAIAASHIPPHSHSSPVHSDWWISNLHPLPPMARMSRRIQPRIIPSPRKRTRIATMASPTVVEIMASGPAKDSGDQCQSRKELCLLLPFIKMQRLRLLPSRPYSQSVMRSSNHLKTLKNPKSKIG